MLRIQVDSSKNFTPNSLQMFNTNSTPRAGKNSARLWLWSEDYSVTK